MHSSDRCRSIQCSDAHSSANGTSTALVSNSALLQNLEWPFATWSCRFKRSLIDHLAIFIDITSMSCCTCFNKKHLDCDFFQVKKSFCTQLKGWHRSSIGSKRIKLWLTSKGFGLFRGYWILCMIIPFGDYHVHVDEIYRIYRLNGLDISLSTSEYHVGQLLQI